MDSSLVHDGLLRIKPIVIAQGEQNILTEFLEGWYGGKIHIAAPGWLPLSVERYQE
jgi:hypothetical protein